MDFAGTYKTPFSFRIVHLEGNMMNVEEAPKTLDLTDGYSIQRDLDKVLINVERSLTDPESETPFVSVKAEVLLELLEGMCEPAVSDEEIVRGFVSYARTDVQMKKLFSCLSHAISSITELVNDTPLITPPMPLYETMD